jgi:L-histidine Nalpha-methyltransferase
MQTVLDHGRIELLNYEEDMFHTQMKKDILRGLMAGQKFLPSRYFYDARGSELFDLICCLPEYYQTRTELSILKESAQVIVQDLRHLDIVELGAGSNLKVRILLDALYRNSPGDICYMPVDVSESALMRSSSGLNKAYPDLRITGIVADFTKYPSSIMTERRRLFVFLGSTIGNLPEEERDRLLGCISGSMAPDDRFLLGLDMIKPAEIINRAYNDTQGITAEFNKNILDVVNRGLNADFSKEQFDHLAFYNPAKEQVEMHLRANRTLSVNIQGLGLQVGILKEETIHTEICRKFSRGSAAAMAENAGLKIRHWFSDPLEWFSLILMEKQ